MDSMVSASPALAAQPFEIQQLAMEMKREIDIFSAYKAERVAAVNNQRVVFKGVLRERTAEMGYVAIKGIMLDRAPPHPSAPASSSDQRSAELEIQILRALSSSNSKQQSSILQTNVVRLQDAFYTSNFLFIVTEWCEGGDLFDYLHAALETNPEFDLSNAAELSKMGAWFAALSASVALVHSKGFAHRDLSPENVLIGGSDGAPSVKLHDFGLACSTSNQTRPVGKLLYAAPELLGPAPHYDPRAADIWSLGIILFSMLSKHVPMNSAAASDRHFQAFCQDPSAYVDLLLSAQKLEGTVSAEAKDLFLKMVTVDRKSVV